MFTFKLPFGAGVLAILLRNPGGYSSPKRRRANGDRSFPARDPSMV